MSYEFSFVASGAAFKPSRLSLPFVRSVDVGEITPSGKGKPMPFGRATLHSPDGQRGRESLLSLCRFAMQCMPTLWAAGAEDFTLWVIREYEDQCNEKLGSNELALIASLNCSLCYSAYKVDGDEA